MALVQDLYLIDEDCLEDWLRVIMNNIEAALLDSGATEGKDYTYRDLMTWAIQLKTSGNLCETLKNIADAINNAA